MSAKRAMYVLDAKIIVYCAEDITHLLVFVRRIYYDNK